MRHGEEIEDVVLLQIELKFFGTNGQWGEFFLGRMVNAQGFFLGRMVNGVFEGSNSPSFKQKRHVAPDS